MEPTPDQTAERSDFLYERTRQLLTHLEKVIRNLVGEQPRLRQEVNPIPLHMHAEFNERARKRCENAAADCAHIRQSRETLRADHLQRMEHSTESIRKSKAMLASMVP